MLRRSGLCIAFVWLLVLAAGANAAEDAPAAGAEATLAATTTSAQASTPASTPASAQASTQASTQAATLGAAAASKDSKADTGPKALSGMSILGNQEAPKALVIVPWKSSQLGDTLGISKTLDDGRQPVDKEVFMRELEYYEIRSQ